MRVFLLMTLLIAMSGLASIRAAQQSPKTDAITGRVMSEDGNPLAKAIVYAYDIANRSQNNHHSTTTDDEGYFRLTGLPPSDYYISASAGGYISAVASATERAENPSNSYFRPGASATITLKKGGVITGRVTDAEGRAVVAVPVSLEYARDENGSARGLTNFENEAWTDDRGVYRFYGLRPGSYLLCAGCRGREDRGVTAFDSDTPTYYPSSARENATEIKVGAGEEATDIDIRYRGERGHAIRGVIAGAPAPNHPPYVSLGSPGAQTGFIYSRIENRSLKFEFEGLPDGEYELIAGRGTSGDDDGAKSVPRLVTIKGGDVNGIELRLIPLGSLTGRFILATDSADCQIQQRKRLADVSPILYNNTVGVQPGYIPGRLNQQNEFAIHGLEAARYRLAAWLPHAEWYLRAITQTGPTPTSRPVDLSRQGITLQSGERKTGLVITVAEGAALLSGKVISATEGVNLPVGLRVYLVPAESASAEDALRYVETEVESNGKFTMRHLAPGRYHLLARPAFNAETSKERPRPATWAADSRAKLLREARASKVEIELRACERVINYALRYESR